MEASAPVRPASTIPCACGARLNKYVWAATLMGPSTANAVIFHTSPVTAVAAGPIIDVRSVWEHLPVGGA